jgi:hypothetical protein
MRELSVDEISGVAGGSSEISGKGPGWVRYHLGDGYHLVVREKGDMVICTPKRCVDLPGTGKT